MPLLNRYSLFLPMPRGLGDGGNYLPNSWSVLPPRGRKPALLRGEGPLTVGPELISNNFSFANAVSDSA